MIGVVGEKAVESDFGRERPIGFEEDAAFEEVDVADFWIEGAGVIVIGLGGVPILDGAIHVAAAEIERGFRRFFADLFGEGDDFFAFIGLGECAKRAECGEEEDQV